MKRLITSASLAAGLCLGASTVNAQTVDEVTFDCTGALTRIVETEKGVVGTGLVDVTVDLPNGKEWRSSGVIVVDLPEQAAGRDINNLRINRCIGEGTLTATPSGQVNGVDVYRLTVVPSRVRIRVGNRRITDPTRVEFGSTADGSPNV